MPTRRHHHDDSVSFRAEDDTLATLFGGPRGATESRGGRRVRSLVALVVSLLLVGAVAWGVVTVSRRLNTPIPLTEQCVATADDRTVVLEHEQMHYAALVAGVAVREGFGERGATIALATAMQESSLRNLTYGDQDSVGLFQQRPSQGWGTRAQILDPFYATETFLEALAKVRWQDGTINDVAQQVQKSGVPDGYAKRVSDATTLAAVFTGRTGTVSCLDRQQSPGSSGTFVEQLNQTWGVSATAQGSTVLVTGATDEIARAWAAFAVANMRQYGVTQVETTDRAWTADTVKQAEWRQVADTGLGARQVRVTFRA